MTKPATGTFGQWLRQWRKENRYSLSGFAQLSGVSPVAIFELEHGKSFNPRLSTLMAISKATRISLAHIATLAADQKMEDSQK